MALGTAALYVTARAYLTGYLAYYGVPVEWVDVPLTQLFHFAIMGIVPALGVLILFYWYARMVGRPTWWSLAPALLIGGVSVWFSYCNHALQVLLFAFVAVALPVAYRLFYGRLSRMWPTLLLSRSLRAVVLALGYLFLYYAVEQFAEIEISSTEDSHYFGPHSWRADAKQLVFVAGDIFVWIDRGDGSCRVYLQKEDRVLGRRWCPHHLPSSMSP